MPGTVTPNASDIQAHDAVIVAAHDRLRGSVARMPNESSEPTDRVARLVMQLDKARINPRCSVCGRDEWDYGPHGRYRPTPCSGAKQRGP